MKVWTYLVVMHLLFFSNSFNIFLDTLDILDVLHDTLDIPKILFYHLGLFLNIGTSKHPLITPTKEPFFLLF